ncbi:MAG: DinB family protein [Anaerolineales bacterium]
MLTSGDQPDESKELFYSQHGVLHSKAVSESDSWSYADQVFLGISQDQLRVIPENHQHSLIWILWHISRIEDVTMNILVADEIQVYLQDGWIHELNSPIHHTGNDIEASVVIGLSQQVNIDQLITYRNQVGKQTRRIVAALSGEDLVQKVSRSRLDRILTEGAVLENSNELIEYWSKKKIFQLLLMPPTRHLLVHLNEAHNLRRSLTD